MRVLTCQFRLTDATCSQLSGPRLCLGNQFALYEAQLILATILPRYQLQLLPGAVVIPEPLVTLRPRGSE